MTQARRVPTVALPGEAAMPLVGLGTWGLRGRRGYDAIRFALELGYRHIDTATAYGNEAEVGRALRDSGLQRREVFLTTKLPPGRAGRARETIAASLRALGTDRVDLWLVHWPPGGRAQPQLWRQLLAIRDEGLARMVGVSNYSTGQLDELIGATGERRPSTRSPGARRGTTHGGWPRTASAAWCWRATARSRAPTSATGSSSRSRLGTA